MGGTLALLFSIAHPLAVTRLILNDVTVKPNRAGVVRASHRYGRAPGKFFTMQDALAWFLQERDNLARLDDETRLAWVSHFLIPTDNGGFRFNCDPVLFQMARQTRWELGPKHKSFQRIICEQASRLKMPVLILRGTDSDVVPPDSARHMVQLLSAASCTEVPGVGHSPTLYEPEAQIALRIFFGISGATAASNSQCRSAP